MTLTTEGPQSCTPQLINPPLVLQVHPHSEDIIIIPENEYCQSNRMTIFVGSIYAYKGLLMVSRTSACNVRGNSQNIFVAIHLELI